MSESSLKRSKNWFRCVGECYEKDLTLGEGTVKLYKDGKATGEEVDCETVSGKVCIKTPNGLITFGVYFSSVGMDGKDSKQWGMAKAMLDKWEPAVNGSGEKPTVVAIEGAVSTNDYLDNQGNVRSGLRWNVRRANTRVSEDEAHGCTLNVTAFVKKIVEEIRDEEPTGRLIIELYAADNKGALIPISTIVEKDLADDFNDLFSNGDTANFDIDNIVRHIGGTKGGKKSFGKGGSVNVNNGFDITELIIVGAEEPIEEPDELTWTDDDGNEHEIETEWMNPKAVRNAMKVREAMLEELKQNSNGGQSKKSGGSALDKAKAAEKSKRVGKSKAKIEESEDDAPWDEDAQELF